MIIFQVGVTDTHFIVGFFAKEKKSKERILLPNSNSPLVFILLLLLKEILCDLLRVLIYVAPYCTSAHQKAAFLRIEVRKEAQYHVK